MSTASELGRQGITKMRQPEWNPYAYLEVAADGSWAHLYDINAGIGSGQPIAMLIADCDRHSNWEPIKESTK